jgi:hypothetical protein
VASPPYVIIILVHRRVDFLVDPALDRPARVVNRLVHGAPQGVPHASVAVDARAAPEQGDEK